MINLLPLQCVYLYAYMCVRKCASMNTSTSNSDRLERRGAAVDLCRWLWWLQSAVMSRARAIVRLVATPVHTGRYLVICTSVGRQSMQAVSRLAAILEHMYAICRL